MKVLRYCAMVGVLITCVLSVQTVKAQELYGDRDNDKNIASGDLNDEDYWWAKFDAMMLDLNIKQDLGSSIRRLDDLARKYPTHREIAKWRARAMQADAKIGPSAIRGASFLPECPWDEATCTSAAEGGHQEVLQWAHSQGCPCDHRVSKYLARQQDNAELLEWARSEGAP